MKEWPSQHKGPEDWIWQTCMSKARMKIELVLQPYAGKQAIDSRQICMNMCYQVALCHARAETMGMKEW